MKKHSVLSLILAFVLFAGGFTGFSGLNARAEVAELTDTQRNAIAMLNYITVLTQEINASKNSRLYMEEAYSSLINNTYPNAVDSRTLSQLTGLLDTMEGYRMVAVKRDRLQYIYEQNQAQAIRAAVPNPLGLLSAVQSFRPEKIALALVYMAVDSYTSYTSYTAEADLQFLKDGWALDDEEATVLHNSRKGTFSYMIRMVGDYELPGDLTLTESAVEEFVKWKNNDNVVARIQFLESNAKTYQSYGGYWLALAESYYHNGDYQKALDAIASYEAVSTRIFRKDYELARILPLAVSAADEILDGGAYADVASRFARMILDNTDHGDWALRYFAAQTYVDLYGKTQDGAYLQSAYDVSLDNVNYLIEEQRALNAAYLAPVQETAVPKDATKDEKKQISDYNKSLKETRKRELPPVYEPLLLNCELLFALAGELDLPENERKKIDGILHPGGEALFLTREIDAAYSMADGAASAASAEVEVEYGGTVIILPAACVTADAAVTVSVELPDAGEAIVLTDWAVDKVQRQAEGDVLSHYVVYTSKEARNIQWTPDAAVSVEVQPKAGFACEPYRFEYVTHGTKNEWYDYLKVWEGHKNNWYDYGKVWENSVEFERVG